MTDVVTKWPAYAKWTRSYLLEHLGEVPLAAGAVSMSLSDFLAYSDVCREERPLYLFDKTWVCRALTSMRSCLFCVGMDVLRGIGWTVPHDTALRS